MTDLRWATREDADALVGLVEEYHRQEGLRAHSQTAIRAVIEDLFHRPNRGRVLLAIDGDEIAGYALVVHSPSFEWAGDVAVLDEIFVRGKSREVGLGRRMISYLEDYAASEGLPRITLEVSVRNVSAREFYRAVGFHLSDREIYGRTVGGPR